MDSGCVGGERHGGGDGDGDGDGDGGTGGVAATRCPGRARKNLTLSVARFTAVIWRSSVDADAADDAYDTTVA